MIALHDQGTIAVVRNHNLLLLMAYSVVGLIFPQLTLKHKCATFIQMFLAS